MQFKKHFTLIAAAAFLSLAIALPVQATGTGQPEKTSLTSYKKKANLSNWPKRKSQTGKRTVPTRMAGSRRTPAHNAGTTTVHTFEAALLYSDSWEEYYHPYGVATFQDESPVTFKQVFENEELPQTGGGFFTDKYYYMTAYSEDWWSGEMSVITYVYEKASWQEVFEKDQDVTALATALAYDAIDDVAYGCFYSDSGSGVDWGYIDPHSLSVTHIAPLEGGLVAVAVNSSGEAYAVTDAGGIDFRNGELFIGGFFHLF